MALITLLGAGCRDDDSCADQRDKVESCNRRYREDVCATADGRCAVACYARLSCAEFDQVDRGDPPAWLSRCTAKCSESFRCDSGDNIEAYYVCDGAKDCADGSDERECVYFECKSGQKAHEDARCDGYAQCGDGSDEEGCP